MPKALTTSILLFFLLLAGLCQASSVSRSFSKNITLMSENINVSLAVSITLPQDTYYAIDESYPSGWTMISTNGDTNQSGHIKWAVIDNAVNTVYSYTIRAAASPGNYTFSGFYEFNSTYTNPSSPSIAGQTLARVRPQGDITGDACVNIFDLTTFGSDFGKTSGFNNPGSDIISNGIVDVFDFVIIGRDYTLGC